MQPILLNFGALDWGIIVGYLVLTTILGERLAGKQATIRDFFLGGRKLPWYAVAGSIIATEISAVTFVSVPFVVYKPGGDFTYLQFGLIGSLLARVIVGYVLVPAYYQREIYSPYDYMANRLGPGVRGVCSALFAFGGILAQGSRVYLTAIVLELALGRAVLAPLEEATGLSTLTLSVLFIGIVSIGWTILGGITTVIWTDVILFIVFLAGATISVLAIAMRLDGGLAELFAAGAEANKFRFFDTTWDPTREYTVWCAAIAVTLGNVGAYGTDQLMAQRMFCCRDGSAARKAIIASAFGQVVTVLVMLVGVGLFAYYRTHPMDAETARLVAEKGDRIFPLFILNEIPSGLSGIIVAGIFAAAISSLDSILAALSQTAMATVYQPIRRSRLAARGLAAPDAAEERHEVRVGRWFVVLAGIVLCLVAIGMEEVAKQYKSILDLALSLAAYSQGGLLAGFLLAFLPLNRDGFGLIFSVPLSALAVFAMNWQPAVLKIATTTTIAGVELPIAWPTLVCYVASAILVAAYLRFAPRDTAPGGLPIVARSIALLAGCGAVIALNDFASFERVVAGEIVHLKLAFPWHAPIGCLFALTLAWLLGNPQRRSAA
jgi:solute:Na+ symporter, SSS family